ncbi:MAG: flagellar export chaperone FliS [Lachnospiraceae bacterium]|nr:flagellar export chaperone FliS [Lachnospiraceae bacterium]
MKDTLKQEFTRRISVANSTDLIVILYDMVLSYADDAEEAIKTDEDHEFYAAISRMRNCINELMCSLHMEYEPAAALLSLYRYCIRKLATAGIRRNIESLDEIRKIIRPLREAYAGLAETNTSGPVMGNSEAVFAGLTYGKNDISESLVNNVNRGMLV